MKKILLLGSQSDKVLGLFKDIENVDGVVVKYPFLKRPVYKYIRKFVFSLSYLGVHIPMPNWIFENDLEEWCRGCSTLVIRNTVLEFTPISKIAGLRERGVRCILLTVESFDAGSNTIKNTEKYFNQKYWDDIITFDPFDAKKYGWTYIGWCYYSQHKTDCMPERNTDLYYVAGVYGNRLKQINDVYSFLSQKGVSCQFDILVTGKKDNDLLQAGINSYRKSIPYTEVLRRTHRSNCILEILREEQHAPSLRYFEAIFYNKKLLTNNPLITGYPYYNPDYMKVFSSVEDIDPDWITDDTPVDYKYSGEFSPTHLVEYLMK